MRAGSPSTGPTRQAPPTCSDRGWTQVVVSPAVPASVWREVSPAISLGTFYRRFLLSRAQACGRDWRWSSSENVPARSCERSDSYEPRLPGSSFLEQRRLEAHWSS